MIRGVGMLTLAIETSCDETSCAVIKDGRQVLSNIISSQIDIHKRFGGVVPEIASRKHIESINNILQEALDTAEVGFKEGKHEYPPYPQTILDKNPNLKQNPGW